MTKRDMQRVRQLLKILIEIQREAMESVRFGDGTLDPEEKDVICYCNSIVSESRRIIRAINQELKKEKESACSKLKT
jgi:hypothetical protein